RALKILVPPYDLTQVFIDEMTHQDDSDKRMRQERRRSTKLSRTLFRRPIRFELSNPRHLSPTARPPMWGLRAEKVTQNMLRTTRASSDIRLGSQGGSQTTLTSTFPTPGTVETASCTITGSSCADGQLGEVSDMSTFTVRSSAMSTR